MASKLIDLDLLGEFKTKMDTLVDTKISTAKTTIEGEIPDVSGKEDSSNKVSSWSATTTDTHYPSEKLVKTALDGKQATISDLSTIRTNANAGAAKVSANNPTVTVKIKGSTVNSFTLNQSTDATVDLGTVITSYNNQTVKGNGTAFGTAAAVNVVGGTNVTVVGDSSANTITISSSYTDTNQTIKGAGTTFGATDAVDIVAGNYITVTSDTTNKKITIASSDTKNTAGSTDTSSKIFLIGATSQADNPQTYSQDTAYVGTDGCLYSGSTKVLTAHQDISGKQDKSNLVTAWESTLSDTKYPSEKLVKNECDEIRKIAAGKTRDYVVDTTLAMPTSSTYSSYYYRDPYGNVLSSYTDFTTYLGFTPSSSNYANSKFDTSDATVNAYDTSTGYGFFIANASAPFVVVRVNPGSTNDLNVGDNVIVKQTSVPDRWYGGNGQFFILETTKVDLSWSNITGKPTASATVATESSGTVTLYKTVEQTTGTIGTGSSTLSLYTKGQTDTLLGKKQNSITDGSATIASVSDGVVTFYKAGQSSGAVTTGAQISGIEVYNTTEVDTQLGKKQNSITDGSATIASVSSGVITLKAVSQSGGAISTGSAITDATTYTNGQIDTLLGNKQPKITDGSATIASVSSNVITFKSVSQSGGAISTGSAITNATTYTTGQIDNLTTLATTAEVDALFA